MTLPRLAVRAMAGLATRPDALGLVLMLSAAPARAQIRIPPYLETRLDVVTGRGTAVQAGAGVVIPAGIYTRISVGGAAGPIWRDGTTGASGRADVIGRFVLDPFRQSRTGISLGAGVSVPYARGDRHVRPYLTAVIDVEGRPGRRLTPALQVGLGGGVRVGVVLRKSPRGSR